jgi:hypothetical protein
MNASACSRLGNNSTTLSLAALTTPKKHVGVEQSVCRLQGRGPL